MIIPIVNEQDEIIEYKNREDRNPKEITRVTGLWLTASNGDILLARRALTKKNQPGLWGPAVSGSVEKDETYESNIKKEAQEEIGLVNVSLDLGPKVRRSTVHEFFAQWFTATIDHDYPLKKQDLELEEMRWFTKDEILKLIKEKSEMFIMGFDEYVKLFIKA